MLSGMHFSGNDFLRKLQETTEITTIKEHAIYDISQFFERQYCIL